MGKSTPSPSKPRMGEFVLCSPAKVKRIDTELKGAFNAGSDITPVLEHSLATGDVTDEDMGEASESDVDSDEEEHAPTEDECMDSGEDDAEKSEKSLRDAIAAIHALAEADERLRLLVKDALLSQLPPKRRNRDVGITMVDRQQSPIKVQIPVDSLLNDEERMTHAKFDRKRDMKSLFYMRNFENVTMSLPSEDEQRSPSKAEGSGKRKRSSADSPESVVEQSSEGVRRSVRVKRLKSNALAG
ncbi:hypothetical protein VNI00_014062 [Paramarasmius palmivorus]|uniref:Uncharacterized protein n=1 Tax=Paramarasmius palmivorus TaxID=297713 RepID=A0AAW0BT98_9AGAR